MKLASISQVIVVLLISIGTAFGQTVAVPAPSASPAAEKLSQEIEKKALSLLERTIGDADSLKLAENRVYVFGSAGAVLWTRDEKRARGLFRRAANELNDFFGGDDEDELPENYWMRQNVRNQFLYSVANLDAELALELLRQTRPAIYERVLNLPPEKIKLNRNLYQQALGDLNLEKDFAARLSKQNPRRALEIARANLSKGVSTTDLNLINQLKDAMPELASQYADEVLQKLIAYDYSDANDYNAGSLAQIFLSQFAAMPESETKDAANKTGQFKIDKNALRRLAAKYADYLSGNNSQMQYNFHQIQNILPVYERILPERVAALRQRYQEFKQNYDAQNQHNQFQERFNQLNDGSTAETLLGEAENFPIEMRSQIYSSAANKMAQTGNYAAGRQFLVSLPGKQSRQSALAQFDWQNLQKFLNEEKYAEAEQIVAQQTDRSQKVRLLVHITNHFSGKKQTEKAAEYLSQARSMVGPNPENYNELHDLIQVLNAGANGETEKAFDLLESFVPKFNEIFGAAAFLSKYQPGYGNFREGELIFSNNSLGFVSLGRNSFGEMSVNLQSMRLDRLGKADLERAARLADRFDRSDVRAAARIMILRGALADEKNPDSQYPMM